MSFHLSRDEVARYERGGYLFPCDVMSAAEAAAARRKIEAFERSLGGPIPREMCHKPHLYSQTIDAIIRRPEILDRVESIIGPDILCWETVLFMKEAKTPAFISWHQDATYWGLEPYEILTAWVALSPSTRESGCMRVLPGSHVGPIAAHKDSFAPNNMLSRGQEIQVEVDQAKVVDLVLRPGQMSLHHVKIAHGSDPNTSDDRRIGLAIRYVPAHVRQALAGSDTATLVRGTDRFGHFEPEPHATSDFSVEGLANQKRLRERRMAILMMPKPPA